MIYGIRKTQIGALNINAEPCKNCFYQGAQTVYVFGRYAHIIWIPIFPLGRKTIAVCPNCQNTLKNVQFSPEMRAQIQQQKKSIKRPLWHYSGLLAALALVVFSTIMILTSTTDPRQAMLDQDEDRMVLQPTLEKDSISYKMKKSFEGSSYWAEQANEFAYFSSSKENRMLMLMKVPKIKKMDKEDRPFVLETVHAVLDLQEGVKDKDRYIGIKGKYTFMVIQSPGNLENSRLASTRYLLDFYGKKE